MCLGLKRIFVCKLSSINQNILYTSSNELKHTHDRTDTHTATHIQPMKIYFAYSSGFFAHLHPPLSTLDLSSSSIAKQYDTVLCHHGYCSLD